MTTNKHGHCQGEVFQSEFFKMVLLTILASTNREGFHTAKIAKYIYYVTYMSVNPSEEALLMIKN